MIAKKQKSKKIIVFEKILIKYMAEQIRVIKAISVFSKKNDIA